MSDFIIRYIQTSDWQDIHELNVKMGYQYEANKVELRIQNILDASTDIVLVLEVDGKVVGYVHGTPYNTLYADRMISIIAFAFTVEYRECKEMTDAILSKLKEALEKNIPIRRIELTDDEKLYIKPFNLLTSKPIIYVANVSEDDLLIGDNKYIKKVREYAKKDNAEVVTICAKVESDLCDMDTEEKNMFLSELGVSESGIDKLIKASYTLLGLKTFFTAGEDECRAWTFKDGMKAPQCAGIIHTDFERGFIKAEIMSYEDLKKAGSEKAVKEAGRMRLEGKEYIMQDGDICYFRFNV